MHHFYLCDISEVPSPLMCVLALGLSLAGVSNHFGHATLFSCESIHGVLLPQGPSPQMDYHCSAIVQPGLAIISVLICMSPLCWLGGVIKVAAGPSGCCSARGSAHMTASIVTPDARPLWLDY